MNVLVLGGTGAIGLHVVSILSASRINAFVTTRSKRISQNNVKYIQGNAHEKEFLNNLLRRCFWDIIIDFMSYDTKEFEERAEVLLKSTKQYIFLSSARVYSEAKTPIKENFSKLLDDCNDRKYLETDEYALSKARQENILKKSMNTNWTIIRPYITYSENRLQLGVLEKEEWLFRAINGRTVVFSSDISSKKTTLTYGADVANGIAAIVGKTQALGQSFNISLNFQHVMTWEEVLSIYLDVIEKQMGFRPNVLFLNYTDFMALRSGESKYQVLYDRIYDRMFDNSKIANYIETDRFRLPANGLRDCLIEFLNNIEFNNINWRREAIKDKLTNEITPLRDIDGVKQKIKYLYYRFGN